MTRPSVSGVKHASTFTANSYVASSVDLENVKMKSHVLKDTQLESATSGEEDFVKRIWNASIGILKEKKGPFQEREHFPTR